VLTILVDECIDGYADDLVRLANDPFWQEFRDTLGLQFVRFRHIGLPNGSEDRVVWQVCRTLRYLLITNNRNCDGPDSLGVLIQTEAGDDAPLVFTIGNMERFDSDPSYARNVIEKLYSYLIDLEDCRDSGRLYLP
jgi:hypothetical protein